MDEIYINDEEVIRLNNAMVTKAFQNRFDESKQKKSMDNVYSDVQETVITENYTLALGKIIAMTGMCFEMMSKSVETFEKIAVEMHSIDTLLERCVSAIKYNGEK